MFRSISGRVISIVGFLLIGFWAGVAWKNQGFSTEEKALMSEKGPDRAPSPRGDLNPSEIATIDLFEAAAPSVCFITTSSIREDF